MDFLHYRGETMVDGVNSRLRRLLGAPIVPARQFRAELKSDPPGILTWIAPVVDIDEGRVKKEVALARR